MGTVVSTGGLRGIEGFSVRVEVDLTRGLPAFHLVGLPNTAVRESRERVLAAVRNSGHRLPAGRVTVNLAPADVRKEGSGHDLAIAVAVIAAERARRQASSPPGERGLLLGELSLFGEVRPVRGLLAIVLDARRRGESVVAVPAEQAWEARLVPGVEVVGVRTLTEAVAWYLHDRRPEATTVLDRAAPPSPPVSELRLALQPLASRAALLAAAGRHHLLLLGPPGTGKTRLARLLVELLPDLGEADGLEVTRIHSAAGLLSRPGLVRRPPLRAPHHTITAAGLLGGGAGLRPGEVTLAHRGVLFLDELAEFGGRILDALREPLTEGVVRLARGTGQRRFPADFQLIAAANPCRCGFLGSRVRECTCGSGDLVRYRSRLSGPLRDRFDLAVELDDGHQESLTSAAARGAGEDGARLRVELAHAQELLRGRGDPPLRWSLTRRVRAYGLEPAALQTLEAARVPLGLSLRGVLRTCRVARTVAALDGRVTVIAADVGEALQFRHETLGCWYAAEG